MTGKAIVVTIDRTGNSTIDLSGFAGNGCAKVADDFRGNDAVSLERNKDEFYQAAQQQNVSQES